jgi:hypothetical protein
MGILDDLAAQYAALTGPQPQANGLLGNVQAAQYRPTPAATFPNAPPSAMPVSMSLPIPPSDPSIWLSPDGTVSYTGRPSGTSGSPQPNNNPPSYNARAATVLIAFGLPIMLPGSRSLQYSALVAVGDDECERQYQRDIFHCKMVGLPACYASAAARYGACLAGRPLPPLSY